MRTFVDRARRDLKRLDSGRWIALYARPLLALVELHAAGDKLRRRRKARRASARPDDTMRMIAETAIARIESKLPPDTKPEHRAKLDEAIARTKEAFGIPVDEPLN